jgi:hypothetical protein
MKELEVRPTKTAATWALIAFLINVLAIYVLYFLNINQESALNYLSYIPFIVCLFLCIRAHKENDLSGYISFGRAFGTGFRFSSLLSLLMGLFMYTYLKWLNPEVFEQSIIQAENQMLDKGNSSEQVETAMEIARNWGPLIAGISITFMTTLTGVVLSLIYAAILKKESPMFGANSDTEL